MMNYTKISSIPSDEYAREKMAQHCDYKSTNLVQCRP